MADSEQSASEERKPIDFPGSSPPGVPDHTLLRKIGSGSYGDVWLAKNVPGEWRAVKVVYRARFEETAPYERELKGLFNYAPISLLHPSLLRVLHVGRDHDDRCFYSIMELAENANGTSTDPETYVAKTLRGMLRERHRLPLSECVAIGLELTTALDQLHQRGFVHRDVKPSNIVFVRGEAKLADIGLVAKYENTLSQVGAEGYMPNEGYGTPQADLYALGKVLYEMSTGLDRRQCPRLPDLRRMALPERKGILELNRVILRACNSIPHRRYPSAAAFKADLQLLGEGSSLRLRRQLKLAMYALAVLAVLLPAALGIQRTWSRAQERARYREVLVRDAQLARIGSHESGWSGHAWKLLTNGASIRVDRELLDQAAATLAGIDAFFIAGTNNMAGSHVAFGPDGSVVAGGLSNAAAHWISANGAIQELPFVGDGPVCFGKDGVPRQFTPVAAGRFQLREMRAGGAVREFVLEGNPAIGKDELPVLAMTPDATRVAAAVGKDETSGIVAVWDATTGRLVGKMEKRASALAFAPDGNLLAVGDANGGVDICRVAGLEASQPLQSGRRASILCLAFARNPLVPYAGEPRTNAWLLAAGDEASGIVIWDLTTGQKRQSCLGSQYGVTGLAFHPNSQILGSANWSEARLWDIATGRCLLTIASGGHGFDYLRGIAFSPDGRQLALVSQRAFTPASISVWKVVQDRGVHVLRGLGSQVAKVWFSTDGRRLAALSHDWHLAVWDLPSEELLLLIEVPQGATADNADGVFHPDGSRVAFAASREARLFELPTGRTLDRWQLPLGFADCLIFDPRNRLLLLRREQRQGDEQPGTWCLRQLQTSGVTGILHEQQDTNWVAYQTALPSRGNIFFVMGWPRSSFHEEGCELRAFDLVTGRRLERWPGMPALSNTSALCDSMGEWLGFRQDKATLFRLIHLPNANKFETISEPAGAIGPDAKWFASCQNSGCILYDRGGTGNGLTLDLDRKASGRPAFSRDGNMLAWGTTEGVVLVAELPEVRRRLDSLGKPHK